MSQTTLFHLLPIGLYRFCGLLLLCNLSWGMTLVASAQIRISENSVVRFATVKEGLHFITQDDIFTQGLSRFDLQVRLRTENIPEIEEWKQWVAQHVQNWEPQDKEKISQLWQKIATRLSELQLPLPHEIYLIATTGQEESNAAYCRGKSIVLPAGVRAKEPLALEFLLLHELFHVISNQHKELRRELYPLIGFQVVDTLAIHSSLRDRKITNPDAPEIDCIMQIDDAGKRLYVAPILYAKNNFSLKQGGSLFDYLQFRLMVMQKDDITWKPAENQGRAVVLDPAKTPSFHKQIGSNTNYIIHPEEILADNFAFMVQEKANLPHPNIVKQLQKVLQNAGK